MTISRNTTGFALSSVAQSFCRAVFKQVPSAGIEEIPAVKREAYSCLTPDELDALALEKIEIEKDDGAVLKDYKVKNNPDVFVTERSFPVLTKFQTIVESIEDQARQRVLSSFTDDERMRLFLEEADYAREFARFQKKAQVLNSKPGQWTIHVPFPPQKGLMQERLEREVRKAVESR